MGDVKVLFQNTNPMSIAADASGRHYEFNNPGLIYTVDERDIPQLLALVGQRCCGQGVQHHFVRAD